jgi:hypothetical protein
MISVKEIHEIENKRKKIKKEIYTKIYEQFCKRIKMSVEMGTKYTELAVPTFLMGYPTFDQIQAAVYLRRQLLNAGFVVRNISPTEFRVSWGVRSSHPKQPPPEEPEALPSLINLKKLASKHKGA